MECNLLIFNELSIEFEQIDSQCILLDGHVSGFGSSNYSEMGNLTRRVNPGADPEQVV